MTKICEPVAHKWGGYYYLKAPRIGDEPYYSANVDVPVEACEKCGLLRLVEAKP